MAAVFGRLDVFWRDGEFHTYPLSENNTSVGRSIGNTIVLDSNNISRYHFNLTYDGDQVFITDMDSANGTFVDGVKLPTNEAQPLYGGEEIVIGDLRLIYNYLDESPTRPMVVPEETTQRIELEAPAFRIDVKGPDQAVSPGAHVSAEISITNTSDEPERYHVEIAGLPGEWVRIDHPELFVAPGKSESVILNFKPARRSDSKPGEYMALVTVRPAGDAKNILQADLFLQILPYAGFGMALESRQVGADGRFRLHLHNQGNSSLPLVIGGRDRNNGLNIRIQPAQVTLSAGQRIVAQGEVQPKRRALFGEDRRYAFDVLARSNDAAGFVAAQRAYMTVPASLPRWLPLAGVGGLVMLGALIVAAVALFALFSTPPIPVINSFTVSSAEVAQGEPVVVSWSVENASALTILINQTPVFVDDGDGSPSSYTLNTSELEGDVTIGLKVENRSASDQTGTLETEYVRVVRPMRIDLFEVEPSQLVRNVVQTLNVSWRVSGATATRLTGLENFTMTPIQSSYGAEATLNDIAGIPQSPLNLTLHAQDAQGNEIAQSVTVNVIDPLCAPANAAVTLRAGPSENYQVIGTVPPNTPVVVDAQDATGQWLRVDLTGSVQGWGARTAFQCADTFDVASLKQELVIPTITPTLEATSTPTATSTERPVVTATPTPRRMPTRTPPPTATRTPVG